jgi:hypothetical protein
VLEFVIDPDFGPALPGAKTTYIVVAGTVPLDGAKVKEVVYGPPSVVEIKKSCGAVITRLSVRLLPETV